ncbi:MAG: nitrate/nitrite transporter NrtS [Hyphomonadaceae bacterium]
MTDMKPAVPVRFWNRLTAAARGPEGRRALIVAILVGTVLNLINQGDALWSHHQFSWPKALLTYLVPFFVSLHGAVSARGGRAL